MRTVLSLLVVLGLTVSVPALAKPKKENLAELPVEETCGHEYARWEYLYAQGKVHSKMEEKDFAGAIEEANIFKGVGLTCWEKRHLSQTLAIAHAANDELDVAFLYMDVAEGLTGLQSHQIDNLRELRAEFESGDWTFRTFEEFQDEALALKEINAADRKAVEVRKPNTRFLVKEMQKYGAGQAFCYVLHHVDIEGKPIDLIAKCSFEKFERAAIQAVKRARFSPRFVDGKPVTEYGIIYPFDLRIK